MAVNFEREMKDKIMEVEKFGQKGLNLRGKN